MDKSELDKLNPRTRSAVIIGYHNGVIDCLSVLKDAGGAATTHAELDLISKLFDKMYDKHQEVTKS
jgi:hypothetical protein